MGSGIGFGFSGEVVVDISCDVDLVLSSRVCAVGVLMSTGVSSDVVFLVVGRCREVCVVELWCVVAVDLCVVFFVVDLREVCVGWVDVVVGFRVVVL